MFQMIAYADSVDDLLFKLNTKIINPAIEFAFIIALVVFLWGVMEYIRGANNQEKRKLGRDHMLWGVIGFLIMFGVFGIISILTRTFGIKGATIDYDQQTFTPPTIQDVNYPK
ncbi:MAG: hypothetical protein KBD54_02660 [Candidatus Pacebacteria bacterium]|nr:hypothetical protein [Candidatus Paceibacterota bacterium]